MGSEMCIRDRHDTFPADPYAVPDRVTARESYAQLAQLYPTHTFRLVQVNVPYAEYVSCLDTVQMLMSPQASHGLVDCRSPLFRLAW